MTTTSRRAGIAGLLIAALVALGAPGASAQLHRHGGTTAERVRSLPIVIGHRGASAYRPEHTLASYTLAIEMGADYIEPDLVSTKDHVLVVRHENDITGTTDVASHKEFADRRTTKVIDGQTITGWFTEDFTLAELKTLRAVERLPDVRPANTAFNGRFEIPTFQEVIDLAKRKGVGIYPETKHPTYFDSIGLSLEEPLLAALRRNRLDRRDAKVFIQSFEVGNLQELDRRTHVPLVQLIDERGAPADLVAAGDRRTYDDLVTPAGLKAIARYADGIGPAKSRIVPLDATRHIMRPTTLIRDAHREGLLVHPFTFRPENTFLAADYQLGDPASSEFPRARGDEPAELALFYRLGVDGVFADNADTAVAVRERTFRRSGG
ncbi:MAG: glycerophosphoryl diester phosphodiesterase [Solirubrobacteraceae bacterium]|jgi:glycerophosphoryl diester phosphodiesterase|nr:glycerophosphoryl diester phosphodiesterase [Solirubrobacteraceae bacterium]